MKLHTVAAIVFIALLPIASIAAPKATKAKAAAPTTYACSVCHMTFSAAEAKKDNYKDTMDGGKLLPVKPAAKAAAKTNTPMTPETYDKTHPADNNSMPGMKM